jgi:hypothetical protein
VRDTRDHRRIDYSLEVLFFVGVLMYVCGLGARRSIKSSLNVLPVKRKLEAIGAPGVPHGDCINDLFKMVAAEEVQEVVSGCTERLVRSRMFDSHRLLNKYYLIAIDGVWTLTFKKPPANNCLSQTHEEKTTYYYMVLEAKLVTSNGLAFSIMSAFVENADPNASKQDCESKAFLRIAERIKKRFSRLPVALLLDGMFATGPVFDICERYGWYYLITLKDKDLPSVMEEVHALAPLQSGNHVKRTCVDGSDRITQAISFVTDISYVDTQKREHTVSVITCEETTTTQLRRPRLVQRALDQNGAVIPTEPTTTKKTFRWITNHTVTCENIWALAHAARGRWKIENEGFNEQKNYGDLNLEHAYSTDPNASKVFYLVLQLAHMIQQLLYKSDLLDAVICSASSMRELHKNMREAWRNVCFIEGLFDPANRFQIRFSPDTG